MIPAAFVWTLLFSGVAGMLLVNLAKANFEPLPTYMVRIISPESKTYNVRNVPLVFEIPNTEHTLPIMEAKIVVDGAILFYFYSMYKFESYDNLMHFYTNASYGLYSVNLTNLSDGRHYVEAWWRSEHPFDHGRTYRVEFAIDTVGPPKVSVISAQNRTHSATDVSLNFTVNQPPSWIGYSLDGKANVTITDDVTVSHVYGRDDCYTIVLTGLGEGPHTLIFYANNTAGSFGKSEQLHFTVDSTPPIVSVLSPEKTTYYAADAQLSFRVTDQTLSWVSYSLDEKENVTVSGEALVQHSLSHSFSAWTGNVTLTELPTGSHSLIVYAKDEVGQTGASDAIEFTVAQKTNAEPYPTTLVAIATVASAAMVSFGLAAYFLRRKGKRSET